MLSTLKPQAEKALAPLAHLLRHVSPNIISLLGLVFPVLFFVCVARGWYALALVALVLTALDMLDGLVARSQNKVTAFGGFLDSTIDRFADFTVIAAFGFAQLVPWEVIMPLLLCTYLISYVRSRTELAAKSKLVASVGWIERTERLVIIFIGLAGYALFSEAQWFDQNILALTCVVLTMLSAVTVGQRILFAYRNL